MRPVPGRDSGADGQRHLDHGNHPRRNPPAKPRPPARSVAGASGNRIRIGSGYITNGGDETDLVVAFNEQVLLGRVRAKELKPDCIILLESMWRSHADPKIVASYIETYDRVVAAGYTERK